MLYEGDRTNQANHVCNSNLASPHHDFYVFSSGVRSRLLKKTGLQIHEVRPVPGGNSTSKSKLGSLGGKSPMRRNIASCFPQKPIQGSTSAPISFKSKNPMHLPSATTRHMVGWGGGPVRPDNSSCLSGAVKSSGSSSARASSSKSSEAKISKGKPVQIVFDDGFFWQTVWCLQDSRVLSPVWRWWIHCDCTIFVVVITQDIFQICSVAWGIGAGKNIVVLK